METKKILIWGEAGVGKTTFCAKFCQDWALVVKDQEGKGQELTEEQKSELKKLTKEQRSKLNNTGLLFYIVLRDIGSKSVKDIIISKLGFNKLNDSQLFSILERVNEHSKFVILMDGFDEVSGKTKQVEEVLTDPNYHKIHSITTCRPHATRGIVLDVDVEIRLKGFSEAQAKAFVEMYAKIKFSKQDQIVSLVKHTIGQIESSSDLLEMSTNPSMLQLLCLLSWKKGKIGKDRTSVFKQYTSYLLVQYHFKLGKTEKSYSDDLYKQNVLDAGKVALMGLKQNQLNLVFSKSEARRIGGNEIFDIGFLTELPSTDTDSVKVQFTHKTLQEFLAAFYVVNTPGDEGLQLLMEFCSTSQRLLGSQIILEFISNMSTDILGNEIQEKIKDFVSKWDSDDKVDPKSRTSFLISMLEGNKTLKFHLPALVDIDFRYNSFKESALERFFGMDGISVRKINLTLDQSTRLNVLQNTTINSLDEFNIASDWLTKTWFRDDNEGLCGVMKKMKPGLLSITDCDWKLMDEAAIGVILQHVHTLILERCGMKQEHLLSILRRRHYLKVLKVNPDFVRIDAEVNHCGVRIDAEVIEAVSKLSSDIKLDINKDNYSVEEIALILVSPTMKYMSMSNCVIDTGIAEAVSRLPDDIQLDLSGNELTKIDPRLVPEVLLHMSKDEEVDMTRCDITIDVDIVKALSKMPQLKSLNASFNKLTPEAAREFSMSQLQKLELSNCGINDTVCVSLMSRLSEHCPLLEVLDLYGINLTSDEFCRYVQIKQLRVLYISDCGLTDTVYESLMISLSEHSPMLEVLYLGGNNLTSDEWCRHVQMKQLMELCLPRCGISNTVCMSLMISLSEHCPLLEVLKLGGNNLRSDEWCHHIQMKKLRELKLPDCGINDTVLVSLMISLSKHCPLMKVLDLSYNKLTSDEWCHHIQMKQLRELDLSNCDIIDTVCVSLMISLSKHCTLLYRLNLSHNNLTSSGVQETVDHIKHLKKLRELRLYGNSCLKYYLCQRQARLALQKSNPGMEVEIGAGYR